MQAVYAVPGSPDMKYLKPVPDGLTRRGSANLRMMTVAANNSKERSRRELIMIAVQPLVKPLVQACVRLGVNPLFLVLLHGLLATVAAVFIVLGHEWWTWAGVLLLMRMLLDNMDGAVARASGQVTQAGRYFDTGTDLITNALLFVALSFTTGPLLAFLAFLMLTWLLSLDFNLERLYLQPRQGTRPLLPPAPTPGPTWLLDVSKRLYSAVMAPQDQLIERIEKRRFARIAGRPYESAPLDWQLAWFDLFSTASLVNLGLSTQTALLALLLFLGVPGVYVTLVLLQGALILLVQVWRGLRFRNYVREETANAG